MGQQKVKKKLVEEELYVGVSGLRKKLWWFCEGRELVW
jgi:hypothetical protein